MNNFTPRAQQVLAHARREADRFNHHYIGTEHLLLGLLKLGKGVAVTILENLGVELSAVRKQVEEQIGRGTEPQAEGNIPSYLISCSAGSETFAVPADAGVSSME